VRAGLGVTPERGEREHALRGELGDEHPLGKATSVGFDERERLTRPTGLQRRAHLREQRELGFERPIAWIAPMGGRRLRRTIRWRIRQIPDVGQVPRPGEHRRVQALASSWPSRTRTRARPLARRPPAPSPTVLVPAGHSSMRSSRLPLHRCEPLRPPSSSRAQPRARRADDGATTRAPRPTRRCVASFRGARSSPHGRRARSRGTARSRRLRSS